jgi:lysophospholipase L1-like esterase
VPRTLLGAVACSLTETVAGLLCVRRWALLAAAAFLVGGVLTPAAQASREARATAIVSLGDSFIAGNAGRWEGNSDTFTGSRDGTDRAWVSDSMYDVSRVYLEGSAGNCFRSDVAEVRSAQIPARERVNLACSGATTADISSPGGQADQLGELARRDRVRLVVLSVGGNDLGFAQAIENCAFAYGFGAGPCNASEQALVDSALPGAVAGVGAALDRIRAVLAAAGYARHRYRLVLQSYPSPVPRADEERYAESDFAGRVFTGRCPFYDADLNWARDSLVPQIAAALRSVAATRGVEFLDLRDALQGREVCAKTAQLATPSSPPSPTRSEWVRFIDYPPGLSLPPLQGDFNESLHPNAYAQRALGRCLTLAWAVRRGAWRCLRPASAGPDGMRLTRER